MSSELTLWRDEGVRISSADADLRDDLSQTSMMDQTGAFLCAVVNTITLTLMLSICSLCGAKHQTVHSGRGEGRHDDGRSLGGDAGTRWR